jgi:hypothetical protein
MAQDFHEAHDRQLLDVRDEFDACLAHRVATDADESIRRTTRAQLSRDASCMQVAGSFAGDE